ncbi:MAG: SDR family NAD(P)-dependent oxidoreductase [Bacteroidota bacterium]
MMHKTILITGANAGLGKESARQFAMRPEVEKIYLGVRNVAKGEAAKAELEEKTGKKVFEVLKIDVSDLESCKAAIANLSAGIDVLVMNAGGMSVRDTLKTNSKGVINMYAVNMLGHSYLLKELLNQNKLRHVALYIGSEAARGMKGLAPKPDLGDFSESLIKSVIDGSYGPNQENERLTYGSIKLIGAMWMSALSRKHAGIKFVTVSPGGTRGTNAFKNAPLPMRMVFKIIMPIMGLFGKFHKLEVGAKRYVDAVTEEQYKSGVFYASKTDSPTGELADQVMFLPEFYNETYQENVYRVVSSYI